MGSKLTHHCEQVGGAVDPADILQFFLQRRDALLFSLRHIHRRGVKIMEFPAFGVEGAGCFGQVIHDFAQEQQVAIAQLWKRPPTAVFSGNGVFLDPRSVDILIEIPPRFDRVVEV